MGHKTIFFLLILLTATRVSVFASQHVVLRGTIGSDGLHHVKNRIAYDMYELEGSAECFKEFTINEILGSSSHDYAIIDNNIDSSYNRVHKGEMVVIQIVDCHLFKSGQTGVYISDWMQNGRTSDEDSQKISWLSGFLLHPSQFTGFDSIEELAEKFGLAEELLPSLLLGDDYKSYDRYFKIPPPIDYFERDKKGQIVRFDKVTTMYFHAKDKKIRSNFQKFLEKVKTKPSRKPSFPMVSGSRYFQLADMILLHPMLLPHVSFTQITTKIF